MSKVQVKAGVTVRKMSLTMTKGQSYNIEVTAYWLQFHCLVTYYYGQVCSGAMFSLGSHLDTRRL